MAEMAVDEGSTTRGGEEKDVDGGEETVPALARESSAELAFYRDFWRLRLTRPVKAGTKKDAHHLHIRQLVVLDLDDNLIPLAFEDASPLVAAADPSSGPAVAIDGDFTSSTHSHYPHSNKEDHWLEYSFSAPLERVARVLVHNRAQCGNRIYGSVLSLRAGRTGEEVMAYEMKKGGGGGNRVMEWVVRGKDDGNEEGVRVAAAGEGDAAAVAVAAVRAEAAAEDTATRVAAAATASRAATGEGAAADATKGKDEDGQGEVDLVGNALMVARQSIPCGLYRREGSGGVAGKGGEGKVEGGEGGDGGGKEGKGGRGGGGGAGEFTLHRAGEGGELYFTEIMKKGKGPQKALWQSSGSSGSSGLSGLSGLTSDDGDNGDDGGDGEVGSLSAETPAQCGAGGFTVTWGNGSTGEMVWPGSVVAAAVGDGAVAGDGAVLGTTGVAADGAEVVVATTAVAAESDEAAAHRPSPSPLSPPLPSSHGCSHLIDVRSGTSYRWMCPLPTVPVGVYTIHHATDHSAGGTKGSTEDRTEDSIDAMVEPGEAVEGGSATAVERGNATAPSMIRLHRGKDNIMCCSVRLVPMAPTEAGAEDEVDEAGMRVHPVGAEREFKGGSWCECTVVPLGASQFRLRVKMGEESETGEKRETGETDEKGEKVENGASSSSSEARRRACEAWLREVEFSLVRGGKMEVSEDGGGGGKGREQGREQG